jgi:hypothetical protein
MNRLSAIIPDTSPEKNLADKYLRFLGNWWKGKLSNGLKPEWYSKKFSSILLTHFSVYLMLYTSSNAG